MTGKKVAAKIRQAPAINDGKGLWVGYLATKPVRLVRMKESVCQVTHENYLSYLAQYGKILKQKPP